MEADKVISVLRHRHGLTPRPSVLITPDDLLAWDVDEEALDAFLDSVSLQVARRYASGELTFDTADAIVNALNLLPLGFESPAVASRPALFWEIYLAFDSGEFHRTRDRSDNPVAEHTVPAIQALLARLSPGALKPLSLEEPAATSARGGGPPLPPDPPRRRDRYRGRRGRGRG